MRHYENAIAHVIAAYVWFAWEIPKQSLQQDDIMSHYSSVVEPTNIRLQVRRPTVTHCTTTTPSWKRDHKMTKLATCRFCAHTTCYWTSCIVTVKVLQSSPYSATAIEKLISLSQALKIIGKEFQKNCSKTIFRKINTEEIFFHLTLITNKDYFQEKSSICENLLSQYMWFISMVVTSLIGANCECL